MFSGPHWALHIYMWEMEIIAPVCPSPGREGGKESRTKKPSRGDTAMTI